MVGTFVLTHPLTPSRLRRDKSLSDPCRERGTAYNTQITCILINC